LESPARETLVDGALACGQMTVGRDFYETIYHFEEDIGEPDQRRLDPAFRLLQPMEAARFLDLGSGVGWAAHIARDAFGTHHAVGADFAWKALRLGVDSLPDVSRVQADGSNLPFRTGAFSRLLSFGSIEHFPDVPAGLRELRRVLSEDGCAVVVVPNFYVRTEQPTEMRRSWFGWRRLFTTAGLEVVTTKADFGPPVFRDARKGRAVLRAGAKALSFVPGLQYQFVFALRPVA
jgi:SAM-dependent methyltransferase